MARGKGPEFTRFFRPIIEAKKEARRDGAPPIELVDGDDLVTLLKSWSLGSVPVKPLM
jgi:hypothetical protein